MRGVFLCSKAVYPQMRENGSGAIINISSGRFWNGTPTGCITRPPRPASSD